MAQRGHIWILSRPRWSPSFVTHFYVEMVVCMNTFQGQVVYHYTSAEGLLSILGTTTLWSSDALFLNDGSELTFARDVLLELGNERVRQGADPAVWDKARRQLLHHLPDSGDIVLPGDVSVYVTSFSTLPDSLNMWQWYGSHGGFAIGFGIDDVLAGLSIEEAHPEASSVAELARSEAYTLKLDNLPLHGSFRTVGYGEEEAREGLTPTIDSIFQADGEVDFRRIVEELACYKHEAFRVESEVRLIVRVYSCVGPTPDLRTARGHLVPYERVRFPYAAIKEICVGPGAYMRRSKRALERHLSTPRGEWSQVVVSLSGIPFIP